MKVVTYSSRSHHDMVLNYLGRSALLHGFDLVIQNGSQHGDGTFANSEWAQSMSDKTRSYLAAAKLLKGEIVLFADADVVICNPFDGGQILGECELVAQRTKNSGICAGLYVARITNDFLEFLTKIAESARFFTAKRPLCDQLWMNKLSSHLQHFSLADTAVFWTPGYTGDRWSRVTDVEDVTIPDGILAAHVNWITGLESKRRMLDRIVAQYELW